MMIPRLSHIEEIAGRSFYITTDAVVGTCLRLPLIDAESSHALERIESLRRWMRSLPPHVLVRWRLHSATVAQAKGNGFRSQAVGQVGWTQTELVGFVECRGEAKALTEIKRVVGLESLGVEKRLEFARSAAADLEAAVPGAQPLSSLEIEDLFFWKQKCGFRVCASFLDLGKEVVGVLRLQRQGLQPLTAMNLAACLMRLPQPFEISVSCRRMDQVKREFVLRTRLNQEESGTDRISRLKAVATGDVLENTFLQGSELFEFEFLVILRAQSELELRSRMKEAEDTLTSVGEVKHETFGSLPSWTATMPGASQHVPILEMDEALMAYLPLTVFGEGAAQSNLPERALLTHRRDHSVAAVDLFSTTAENANAVIVGASGKGKSVLTGLLTSSLLADPKVRVIKVDVGGSHTRECELFGGREYSMSLDRPSGINPFAFAKQNGSEGLRAILGKFIEVLVLDEKELTPPKTVRVEIDDLLATYLAGAGDTASLDGFYAHAKSFSRRTLLSRWCEKGLYGKAFAGQDAGADLDARLRYFNFSQIFQAGDADFSQAGMAAVLAQFNLELLANPDARLVLICDETPFFIQRCFDFFKFSMANVRKFGASIVLVVQLSQHLVRGEDTDLIFNAFHRFLFSADGDPSTFAKRFETGAELIEKIRGLRAIPGQQSEVLYQYAQETRALVLKLTREEYWRVTSSPGDRLKVQKLRAAVPELTLEEALSCLVRIS